MSEHSAQGIVLVKRKPENANGDVLKQQITLVAKDGAKFFKISDLTQFIKDLEGAGIVVSENQIDLIADKTYIRDGKNGTPIALFADGKLNANLINADTITVNHLYAKSAQGGTVVGHFGNYEKSDAVAGEDKCPLWLGATTAANAPFRVTKDGAMYAIKGTIGGFEIGTEQLGVANSSTNFGLRENDMCLRRNGFWLWGRGELQGKVYNYASNISLSPSYEGGHIMVVDDFVLSSSETARTLIYLRSTSPSKSGTTSFSNKGLCININGASEDGGTSDSGNHALWIENGDVAGFRLRVKIVSKSYTITKFDNIIVNTATNNDVVLTLPTPSDSRGQVIIITNRNNHTSKIKGIIWKRGLVSEVTHSGYATGMLVSDGEYWIWRWFNM